MKAYIFDLDGTLISFSIDFEKMRKAVKELYLEEGIDLSFVPMLENIEKASLILREKGLPQNYIEELKRKAMEIIDEIEIESIREAYVLPYVVEKLTELRNSGAKIAVVTRAGKRHLRLGIDKIGFEFDAAICREDVKEPKPSPESYLKALERMGCKDCKDVIVVGDYVFDIEAGRAIGAYCVGVLTGSGTRELLSCADLVIENFKHLP